MWRACRCQPSDSRARGGRLPDLDGAIELVLGVLVRVVEHEVLAPGLGEREALRDFLLEVLRRPLLESLPVVAYVRR